MAVSKLELASEQARLEAEKHAAKMGKKIKYVEPVPGTQVDQSVYTEAQKQKLTILDGEKGQEEQGFFDDIKTDTRPNLHVVQEGENKDGLLPDEVEFLRQREVENKQKRHEQLMADEKTKAEPIKTKKSNNDANVVLAKSLKAVYEPGFASRPDKEQITANLINALVEREAVNQQGVIVSPELRAKLEGLVTLPNEAVLHQMVADKDLVDLTKYAKPIPTIDELVKVETDHLKAKEEVKAAQQKVIATQQVEENFYKGLPEPTKAEIKRDQGSSADMTAHVEKTLALDRIVAKFKKKEPMHYENLVGLAKAGNIKTFNTYFTEDMTTEEQEDLAPALKLNEATALYSENLEQKIKTMAVAPISRWKKVLNFFTGR